MLNPALLSCFSIISPTTSTILMMSLLNKISEKKRKKNNVIYESVFERLEQVSSELEKMINCNPIMVDILAMRLLDIMECKRILAEVKNKDERLNHVIEKLTRLINNYRERIEGLSVHIEVLKTILSDVEECKNIITAEMKPHLVTPVIC